MDGNRNVNDSSLPQGGNQPPAGHNEAERLEEAETEDARIQSESERGYFNTRTVVKSVAGGGVLAGFAWALGGVSLPVAGGIFAAYSLFQGHAYYRENQVKLLQKQVTIKDRKIERMVKVEPRLVSADQSMQTEVPGTGQEIQTDLQADLQVVSPDSPDEGESTDSSGGGESTASSRERESSSLSDAGFIYDDEDFTRKDGQNANEDIVGLINEATGQVSLFSYLDVCNKLEDAKKRIEQLEVTDKSIYESINPVTGEVTLVQYADVHEQLEKAKERIKELEDAAYTETLTEESLRVVENSKLGEKDREIEFLKEEKATIIEKHEELISNMECELGKVTKKNNELTQELTNSAENLREAELKTFDFQGQLEIQKNDAEKQMSKNIRDAVLLKEKIEALKEEKTAAEDRYKKIIENLEKQHDQAILKINKRNEDFFTEQGEAFNDTLKERQSLTKEVSSLKRRLDTQESSLNKAVAEVEKLRADNAEWKGIFENLAANSTSLSKKLHELVPGELHDELREALGEFTKK